jgi:hypothetical protein
MEPGSPPGEKPLTPEEWERFERRERQAALVHAAALGAFLLAALAAYRWGDSTWIRGLFIGVIGVLVAAGAVAQLSQRCPRCGARVRRKLLVAPPDACAACGVRLGPPPKDDGVVSAGG